MEQQNERLTDDELYVLFDRLFPNGFAGPDVLAEIAPRGWPQSPLVACFHPSIERVLEERLQVHRNFEELYATRRGPTHGEHVHRPPPTLEDVRRDYEPEPVCVTEEVTELIGLCLWDVFSDNHDVIMADGRAADIGSFRAAGAFLAEYLARDRNHWDAGDYMRFYMGTAWIGARADWVYHFPELFLVDLAPLVADAESSPTEYDVSKAALAELTSAARRADLERLRADVAASNQRARDAALDRVAPATVRAYREVYGRDPRGWPPA